jgi:hypothetical protein
VLCFGTQPESWDHVTCCDLLWWGWDEAGMKLGDVAAKLWGVGAPQVDDSAHSARASQPQVAGGQRRPLGAGGCLPAVSPNDRGGDC